ncbi:MAG: DMT family transporter [Ilumatobacteraceae bacterium]
MQRQDGIAQAFVAMSLVGGAITASTYLADGRITSQAVRYAATALVLVVVSRRRHEYDDAWRLRRPRGSGWVWLVGAATCGLTIYNLALVEALQRADTPLVASIVSAVPLVLALAAPLGLGQTVAGRVVFGAAIVVAGSVLVYGTGDASATGAGLSIVALVGECAFTLLGARVLHTVGAVSIATHTAWIAAAELAVLSVVLDGGQRTGWDLPAVGAIGYLVAASAAAFVLWFDAIESIGPAVAGLAAGAIPVAALVTGTLLGTAILTPSSLGGVVVVVAGIAVALRHSPASKEVIVPS